MAEVVLEHVRKQYAPGAVAVDDLSLTVADGELLVLVGPSGCGKTTTLRLVAGLESPTAGSIHIGGRDVTRRPPRERDVAVVFQRPALYPHLSVADNLAFGMDLREGGGVFRRLFRRAETARRAAERAERVADAARALGLSDLLERRPDQLSGGQQQRVALGRALVRRPAVFLLDEPLSNLDPALRHEMRRELHLLQRRLRATMLYVTHDQVEAMTLGDRVVVLDGGRVQQSGRPLDLYERPDNRFVAGFLGWPPMNFLDGRLGRDERGRPSFLTDGCHWLLPERLAPAALAHAGGEATLGIRPDHVALEGGEVVHYPSPRLTMDVLLVEPLGSTTLVTLGRDGRQLLAQVGSGTSLRERRTVEVALNMDKAHLFDRASGRTLSDGAPSG